MTSFEAEQILEEIRAEADSNLDDAEDREELIQNLKGIISNLERLEFIEEPDDGSDLAYEARRDMILCGVA